jgi:ankyrin repeat protein
MKQFFFISMEEVTRWPLLVQSSVIACLVFVAIFSRFSTESYSKKAFALLNALLGLLAVYYAFGAKDFVAGGFFALAAGAGYYLHQKNGYLISFKSLLLIWLISVIGIVVCFGMFKDVYFTDEIRVNHPIRLPMIEWYVFWGVFALGAIVWSFWYAKRSSLPKWESWGNAISIITLAFWGTYFFFNTFDAQHQVNEYVNRDAFDEVTADIRLGWWVNAKDKYGRTLLHQAIEKRDFDEVKRLVAEGADVNVKGGRHALRRTPLTLAVGHSYEIFQYLIEHGADVNLQTDIAHNAGALTPLHHAIMSVNNNDLKYVTTLLKHGADLNIRGMSDMQPIHVAAEGSNSIKGDYFPRVELIKLLVNNGADVNSKAGFGTPLHYAVFGGNILGAKKLVELGADTTLTNRKGETPLENAKKLVGIKYGKVAEITINKNERRKEIIEYLEQLVDKSPSAEADISEGM